MFYRIFYLVLNSPVSSAGTGDTKEMLVLEKRMSNVIRITNTTGTTGLLGPALQGPLVTWQMPPAQSGALRKHSPEQG